MGNYFTVPVYNVFGPAAACLVMWRFPCHSFKTHKWSWTDISIPVGLLSLWYIHHIHSRYMIEKHSIYDQPVYKDHQSYITIMCLIHQRSHKTSLTVYLTDPGHINYIGFVIWLRNLFKERQLLSKITCMWILIL